MATKSRLSDYVELRDTTTWELVWSMDVEYEDDIEVAFSADDKCIAVLTDDRATVCDIMHPENRLSFDPLPEGISVHKWKAAFQTCNDLVICADLGLLQVWKLKDHSECTFSLEINMDKRSDILLAPDGLILIDDPTSCYSWNYETAQFDRIHFTDEAHLDRYSMTYSPDGKLFACHSPIDNDIRVWDT